MPKKRDQDDITSSPQGGGLGGPFVDPLVTVETQREADLFSGEWAERTFVKLYVAARESGLLAAISDRDWKTLCTLATYMDGDGYCHPSQAELARAMGCSRQMANERVRSLSNFRFRGQQVLLVVKEGRTGKGEWARNGYKVLPIARLRIYDSPEPRQQTDSENDTSETGSSTVSSVLDTVAADEPTVSSPTVTVPLDTNKNQALERDIDLSNFEGFHDGVDKSGTTPEGNDGRPGEEPSPGAARPTASGRAGLSDSAGQGRRGESPRYVPPGELQELRRRAAATIGHDGATATAGPGLGDDPAAASKEGAARGNRGGLRGTTEERERLGAYLTDFANELGDEAPLSSTITRALNVFKAASIHPDNWGGYLYEARAVTQERTAQITKPAATGASGMRRKNKMPYYFRVLEQLVGLRPTPSVQPRATDHPR